MATLNFYLEKPGKKGLSPIFLVYQSRGKKFKHFIKEKVNAKYWDITNQRVKSSVIGSQDINDIIKLESGKLWKAARELRLLNDNFTIDDIRSRYLNTEKRVAGILPFFEAFIESRKSSNQRKTLKEFQTIINDLRGFEEYFNEKLSFSSINDTFKNKFLEYLTDKKKNSLNTIAKKISTLKTMMKAATKAGNNTLMDYQDFKVKKVDVSKVFLTKEELLQLYDTDFSKNDRLNKVRDMFCFGCFTGLRYSDIDALREENIIKKKGQNGVEFQALNLTIVKTKDELIVPLNRYAIQLIEKYKERDKSNFKEYPTGDIGQRIFPRISNQKMNGYLKEVCEIAQINDSFMQTKYVGTKRINEVYKKYQLISSHAARRTFAILSLDQGMRVEVLQKILGHSNIRTTLEYVTILDEVKNREMQAAWTNFSS